MTSAQNIAYAAGRIFAETDLAYGLTEPHANPLNGEWADAPKPATIFKQSTQTDFTPASADLLESVVAAWESGYASAFALPAAA
jgi:hypothetical protein